MARSFASASSQYYEGAYAPLTAMPLTISAWMYTAGTTAAAAVCVGTNGGNARWQLQVNGDSTQKIEALAANSAGTSSGARTTVAWSDNTWFHGAAVFTSSTSRTAYFNGGSSATDTTSIATSSTDRFVVGARRNSVGIAAYWNGRIAEVGVWNVALTAAEVTMLALRISPLLVRPDALVAYVPLVGRVSPEVDWFSATTLTASGSAPTQAEHQRIFYPGSNVIPLHPAAAAAGSGGGIIGGRLVNRSLVYRGRLVA